MNQSEKEYLAKSFSDLINYESENALAPIDPIAYRTPEGDSCLHLAAIRGDLTAVQILLSAGLDVNMKGDLGNTPLHYATMAKNSDIIELLITHGAKTDLINELGDNASGI